MLYQLDSYLLDGIILLLDFIVVGLLVYLFRQPRDVFYKWWAILALVLLALPLSGIKLLRSSPGSVASSPGFITIRNPEQRMAKLYYLQHRLNEPWQVDWVEYMVSAGKETVVELEGYDGLEVAYQRAGQWRYVPVRFTKGESTITFPQDFTAVDMSGHIEAAVNRHLLAECITWLSHLLTLGSIGLTRPDTSVVRALYPWCSHPKTPQCGHLASCFPKSKKARAPHGSRAFLMR